MSVVNIAIDSGPLKSGHSIRGVGVNTRELIDAIKKEINNPENKNIKIHEVDFGSADFSRYDLVHYTAFHPYFLSLPEKKQAEKILITIHDLIYLLYPDKYPSGIKGKINFYKNTSRLKNVDAVLTISETSKKDIVRFLQIPAEKIKVIYLAAKDIYKPVLNKKELEKIRNKYNLPNKFVLYVGDTNYNKNLITLLKATDKIGIPLVIVGKKAAELNKYVSDIKSLTGPRDYLRYLFGINHPEVIHYNELIDLINKTGVITPGFVPDNELIKIYNLATVYVQPSFYEGFGLPVLEAMACGIPVIVSKTNALTEIAGGAALTFNPNDINELSEKIKSISGSVNSKSISPLAKSLSQKGIKRAEEFTWQETAKETIKYYQELLND